MLCIGGKCARCCYVQLGCWCCYCCYFYLVIVFVVLVWPIGWRSGLFSRSQMFLSAVRQSVLYFHVGVSSMRHDSIDIVCSFLENEFISKHRKLARNYTNNNKSIGTLTWINILIPKWNKKRVVFSLLLHKIANHLDCFRLRYSSTTFRNVWINITFYSCQWVSVFIPVARMSLKFIDELIE